MNNTRSVMSARTFGLLSTLSLFSVGAFTVFMLSQSPTTTANRMEPESTNTKQIDQTRVAATDNESNRDTESSEPGDASSPTVAASPRSTQVNSTNQNPTPDTESTPPETTQRSNDQQPASQPSRETNDTESGQPQRRGPLESIVQSVFSVFSS